MPGAPVIPRQLPVKEECVGGASSQVRLQSCPSLCHLMYNRRNDILTGRAHEIRDLVSPAVSDDFHGRLRQKRTVHNRAADHGHVGALLRQRVKYFKDYSGLCLPHTLSARFGHPAVQLTPEGFHILQRRGGGKSFRHTATAHHYGSADAAFRQRGEAVLLHAHGAGRLSHQGDPVRIAAKRGDIAADP